MTRRARFDEVLVAFGRHQPRDGADRERVRRDAERAPGLGHFVGGSHAAELLERHAEVDDLRALGGNRAVPAW